MTVFVALFLRTKLGLPIMVGQLVIPFVIYQFGDGMQCNYSNALRGISTS